MEVEHSHNFFKRRSMLSVFQAAQPLSVSLSTLQTQALRSMHFSSGLQQSESMSAKLPQRFHLNYRQSINSSLRLSSRRLERRPGRSMKIELRFSRYPYLWLSSGASLTFSQINSNQWSENRCAWPWDTYVTVLDVTWYILRQKKNYRLNSTKLWSQDI